MEEKSWLSMSPGFTFLDNPFGLSPHPCLIPRVRTFLHRSTCPHRSKVVLLFPSERIFSGLASCFHQFNSDVGPPPLFRRESFATKRAEPFPDDVRPLHLRPIVLRSCPSLILGNCKNSRRLQALPCFFPPDFTSLLGLRFLYPSSKPSSSQMGNRPLLFYISPFFNDTICLLMVF